MDKFKTQDDIETWVHKFLTNEGDNLALSEGLKKQKRFWWYGEVNLNITKRICGPEKDMEYVEDETWFNDVVGKMVNSINAGWEVPPLICEYIDGSYFLRDGNHRYEALKRAGRDSHGILVWFNSEDELTPTPLFQERG